MRRIVWKLLCLTILAGFFIGLASTASRAAVWYVKENRDGISLDGTSWATPFAHISEALAVAQPQDEVWVTAGTYPELLTVPASIALYGGFTGTETARDQRDWAAHPTTLDGVYNGPVVDFATGAASDTVLDGFTVRNGSATNGGGIRCLGASPTIVHSIIREDNAAVGGGLYCQSASPLISNCLFIGNSSNSGSAIAANGSSAPHVVNCTFYDNYGSSGTVATFSGAGLTLANTIVAFNNSGGIAVGGLLGPKPTLSHCDVYGNTGSNFSGMTDPGPTGGNIGQDPAFRSANAGDIHLSASSPCKDAGDNAATQAVAKDLDGAPRVADTIVDMGAYELSIVIPVRLSFSSQPGPGRAGSPLPNQPQVQALDQAGNLTAYSGPVTLALQAGSGTANASLLGTATVNATNGVATFTGIGVDRAGTGYVLTAASGSLTPAMSAPFTVAPVATKLVFTRQPVGGAPNSVLSVQPQVTAQFDDGSTDTGFAGPVTVQFKAGTGDNNTLFGTTTVNAAYGVADFTDLGVGMVGTGYVLHATSGVLAPADSAAFNVIDRAVRVSANGNDQNDGLTWATAKRNIQPAIIAASQNHYGKVWVAAGTYERFSMVNGVDVYGGFNGTETVTGQRNWVVNVTIIDGHSGYTVVDFGNNCTARLDGFTIRNGWGQLADTSGNKMAGGISAFGGSPVIANNIIEQNNGRTLGGGIYLSGGSATITGNTITSNTADAAGGIYCYGGAPTITHNRIRGNGALTKDGAALLVNGGTPMITDNEFDTNAAYAGAGAGAWLTGTKDAVIERNVFSNNFSSTDGGALWFFSTTNTLVRDNVITNSSGNGNGAVFEGGFNPGCRILNNTLVGNRLGGAALFITSGAAVVMNNLIAYNEKGLYLDSSQTTTGYNCVYYNRTGDYVNASPAATDIRQDPKLPVNPSVPPRLQPGSPCIDAGNNGVVTEPAPVDVEGKVRIYNGRVDIGAYEYHLTPYTMDDVKRVLLINSGMDMASADDMARLNVDIVGAASAYINMADSMHLLRKVLGQEPNP